MPIVKGISANLSVFFTRFFYIGAQFVHIPTKIVLLSTRFSHRLLVASPGLSLVLSVGDRLLGEGGLKAFPSVTVGEAD
jgi:hypothetical protein